MTKTVVLFASLVLCGWLCVHLWRSLRSQAEFANALPGSNALCRELSGKYSGVLMVVDTVAHPQSCGVVRQLEEYLNSKDCRLLVIDGPSVLGERPELIPLLNLEGYPAVLLLERGLLIESCMLLPDGQFVPNAKEWFRQAKCLLRKG